MKIAVIGGGSTYTPELVSGLSRERGRIDVSDLVHRELRQVRDELRRVRRARADDSQFHPFTPVSVTPSTNAFCAAKNSAITGAMKSRVAAIVRFHCTW